MKSFTLTAMAVCFWTAGCGLGDQASFLKSHDSKGGGVWIKTDTHMHSQLSDGRHSVLELAARARRSGCQAISVTDHAELAFAYGPEKYEEAVRVARLQNPDLIILAGVEWNVPPWGGREHATVVVPPSPDEFLRLADFSARFDDFELEPDKKPRSAEAIEWLRTSTTSGAVSPLVMFEHPGRKVSSSVESGTNFRQLCTDSSIVVGFSGAPGHQKQEQNRGAYEGPVQLIDRWDPVVAEAGGVWDQLLMSGQDVWAAHAPSDFHAEQNDYWPGEFSETWVHAAESTAESLLQAMQRGRFFGVHGHIVREVELQVGLAGLERPAESGETVAVTAGQSVTVSVRGRIPPTDCFGRPNRIDAVELIVAEPRGTRTIAIAGPFVGELSAETSIVVREGGLTVRARGRRSVTGEPDLCFYTNPVRIVARADVGLLAALLPVGWRNGGRMAIGLTMLVLTVVAAGSSLSGVLAGERPRSPMVREIPPERKVTGKVTGTGFPHRGHLLMAAAGFTVIALYGSWVPLNFTPRTFDEARQRFSEIRWLSLGVGGRADWVANILLFIPIGYFWMGAGVLNFRRTSWRMLPWGVVVGMTCIAASIAIEFSQVWFPPRTVSLNDIVAESIGGAVGIVLWMMTGRPLMGWLRTLESTRLQATQLDRLLQLWVFGLFVYAVLPLDLTIHPAEIAQKWREGRIVPIPFWKNDFGVQAMWDRVSDILLFVPVGLLAARERTDGRLQLRPFGLSLCYGAAFVLFLECFQIFVYTRYAEMSDVLTGTMGVAIGAAVARRTSGHSRQITEGSLATHRAVLAALAVAWSVVVVLIFCWPLQPDLSGDQALVRLRGILRVPFSSLYWGTEFNFATQVLRKTLFFAPLGVFLALLADSFALPRGVRILLSTLIVCCGLVIGTGIEILQTAMSKHVADITDILLYGFGTLAGVVVTRRMKDSGVLRADVSGFPDPLRDHVRATSDTRGGRAVTKHLHRNRVGIIAGAAVVIFAVGVVLLQRTGSSDRAEFGVPRSAAGRAVGLPVRTLAARSGTPFLPVAMGADRCPAIEMIEIPDFGGAAAVWGATGRDDRGHLWFGVSAEGVENPSAHLFELPPESRVATDRGNVVSELRRNGLFRNDEGQMKIHSKILQADDGHLYFASMDEQGEADDGSRLPTWGSHLWRLHLPDYQWEHLMSVPEGLIAIAGFGRNLYTLGLFGHVVYRFDMDTGESDSVRVGSVKGHVSRNFFCDASGHVYVPKLALQPPETAGPVSEAPNSGGLAASLVELDQNLTIVAETPLEHYVNRDYWSDHGLTAFVPLQDGSIVFATSQGFLYRLFPGDGAAARLESLGWFHPDGPAYTPALFTFDGDRFLGGIQFGNARYEWIALDLRTGARTVHDLTMALKSAGLNKLALYGSVTRDDLGRFLVGGRAEQEGHMRPVVLRLAVPTE